MKGFLNLLFKYNGQILTNLLAETIMGEAIQYGLYRPTRGITPEIERKWGSKRISETSTIGLELLSEQETVKLLTDNPQNHKEAGFENGWPSRFATIFDFAKELGFVYYWIDQRIEFSEIGKKLAHSVDIKPISNFIYIKEIYPELEHQAFLNSLVKYQRNNPFIKVLNENVPLILLLQVIKKINNDPDFNNSGILKLELPLILFWKNNNSEELYQLIKSIRSTYGYNPTWEFIIDLCINGIMGGEFKKIKPSSIMEEYPDEFIRKMRLTRLISLRGAGRFIDINQNEIVKVDYVLNKYSQYSKFNSEKEYFNYASTIDPHLISLKPKLIQTSDKEEHLRKWAKIFTWDAIKNELTNLSNKKLSEDKILKYLPNPVRLEFLMALSIKSRFPDAKIIPNYPIDDEGLPTSTAGGVGNIGDIECFENSKGILIEVTMSEGRTQTMMEVWPISRHLVEFSKKSKDSMCYFIAPSIFADTFKQINYVKDTENLNIKHYTILEFINHLENAEMLYS